MLPALPVPNVDTVSVYIMLAQSSPLLQFLSTCVARTTSAFCVHWHCADNNIIYGAPSHKIPGHLNRSVDTGISSHARTHTHTHTELHACAAPVEVCMQIHLHTCTHTHTHTHTKQQILKNNSYWSSWSHGDVNGQLYKTAFSLF